MLVTDILRKSPYAARGLEKSRLYQVVKGGLLNVGMMPVDVLNNQPRISGKKMCV